MEAFTERLLASLIVPVITINTVKHAAPLAIALAAGGLRNLEITLRTPAAFEAIAEMKSAVPHLSIGAGTVLAAEDVERCLKAGADFLVTPGSTPRLRSALLSAKVDVMVGVATVSEVMAALDEGFSVLKFFPAEQIGGAAALAAIGGPLPHALFCPTGGITPEKINNYINLNNVVAIGGTWICPQALIDASDFETIEANARRAAAFRKAG